jgi:Tfp pilus assembly protein PilN
MIKINLLDSVTDRPTGVAVAVEDKVANPLAQTLILALLVFGLLMVGLFYDFVSARRARDVAQKELEKQQRINQQMLAITKEQAEVEKKTKEIQTRIDAIQKLRASQQGPGAVLREIKARFDSVPGLYLKSVEQKDNEITIKGESPDEAAVTRFGQKLEFSNGLFSNLSIETVREAAKIEEPPPSAASSPASPTAPAASSANNDEYRPEVVSFVIKVSYTGSSTPVQAANTAATQPNNQNGAQIAQK